MTDEQSIIFILSIVLGICLTINTVSLVEDTSKGNDKQQLGLIIRFATMLVMLVVWLITILD